jgi:hypothetical protein
VTDKITDKAHTLQASRSLAQSCALVSQLQQAASTRLCRGEYRSRFSLCLRLFWRWGCVSFRRSVLSFPLHILFFLHQPKSKLEPVSPLADVGWPERRGPKGTRQIPRKRRRRRTFGPLGVARTGGIDQQHERWVGQTVVGEYS